MKSKAITHFIHYQVVQNLRHWKKNLTFGVMVLFDQKAMRDVKTNGFVSI